MVGGMAVRRYVLLPTLLGARTLWALHFALAPRVDAQAPPQDVTPRPLATLSVWADNVWLALTDRDGSYFGRLADEGTFQRFNPLMDTEYELDVRTALFTPSEDARWVAVRRGLRVAGASINHPFVLNCIDWREEVPISGPVDLLARYRRQRSLTAQRDYARVGVRWRDALGSSWTLRSSIGVHFFKASADVELGVVGRWADANGGRWMLDLRVAMLDAFNNVIFNALGVRPEDTPAHFDYTTVPFAARVGVVRSSPSWRVEVQGGLSNRTEVVVSFPASGDPSFDLFEHVSFLGALAEVALSARVAVAAYGTAARAETDRRFTPTSPDDLELREETWTLGLRGGLATTRTLTFELDLGGVWRPETRGVAGGLSQHVSDRELFGQLALVRRPLTGWSWRLTYAFVDRDAGVLPELTAVNHRHVMEGGYRFQSGFELMGGLRWDLDDFPVAPFDGGHLRFSATW